MVPMEANMVAILGESGGKWLRSFEKAAGGSARDSAGSACGDRRQPLQVPLGMGDDGGLREPPVVPLGGGQNRRGAAGCPAAPLSGARSPMANRSRSWRPFRSSMTPCTYVSIAQRWLPV
jgi:hypothetical protein